MTQVFVIKPSGAKRDASGRKIDFDRVQKELVAPVLEAAQLGVCATCDLIDSGAIREEVYAALLNADLVICDITLQDANVYYALGLRQALRRRRTLLIKGQPSDDSGPFEHGPSGYIPYDIGSPAAARERLLDAVVTLLRDGSRTDSPHFQVSPTANELQLLPLDPVPADFGAEFERARIGGARGWLRLLAGEVKGRRFQQQGLTLLARAQYELHDWDGARSSWEAVRQLLPDDVETNLALANVYAQLHRISQRHDALEASDQALFRVLKSDKTLRRQRTEALALAGQNQKMRWRSQFENVNKVEERRAQAMSRSALRSFEYYREAFLQDLNHFYPGLAALQMGILLSNLAATEAWYDAFDRDSEAEGYKRQLDEQLASLRQLVPASLDADLQRLRQDDTERFWAEVCAADVLFLTTEGREQRVVSAYLHALPLDKPFACEAARRQLELFVSLDVRAVLAGKVLQALGERFPAPASAASDNKRRAQTVAHHVVLVVSDSSEGSGRLQAMTRFGGEAQAKALLHRTLDDLTGDAERATVIASGAPGMDVLAHEVAAELGVDSLICLPTRRDDFTRSMYAGLDAWKQRFNEIAKSTRTLELSDTGELPRWLQGTMTTVPERLGHWLIELVRAMEADRISVVLSSDAKSGGVANLPAVITQLLKDQVDINLIQINENTEAKQIA